MNKTIEQTFFKAFEFGGVVDLCIRYFQEKYDLGCYPKKHKELPPKWEEYYYIELPEIILKETERFDDCSLVYKSPLIDEIEKNLQECTTTKEQDRYLFSLLTPFKRFSDIFLPIATINRLEKDIEKYKQKKEFWQNSEAGDKAKQIEACDWFIERREKEIERTYYIERRFMEIINEKNEKNTVECCFGMFFSIAMRFADRLDALLLTYGIDLMRLQKESGIYLKTHRNVVDVDTYIGSIELAQKYIDELPKSNTISTKDTATNEPQQPPHFNGDYTDEELTATFNKLIQGKYIHSESDLESFIYLCTGREGKAFKKPINWLKPATLLGLFIKDLFSDTDQTAIWEQTAKCFTIKGKTPNTSSIKVSLSKIKQDWKDRPKGYDVMQNEIIKDLK